jgi:FHA domain
VATCPAGHTSASEDYCEVCGLPIGAAPTFAPPAPAPAASGYGTAVGPTVVAGPGESCPQCGAARSGNFCESCGHDFIQADPVTLDPAVFRSAPPLPGLLRPAPPAPVPAPVPAPAPPVPVAAPAPSVSAPPASAPAPQAGTGPAVPAPPGPAARAEWTAVVSADRAYYDAVQAAGGPDAAGIVFPAYFPQRRFRLTGAEVRIGRQSASSGIDPEIDLSVPPADPGVSRLHAVLLRSADGSYSVVDPGSANGTAVNGSEIPPGQAVPLRDGDRIHLGAWTELRLVRGA